MIGKVIKEIAPCQNNPRNSEGCFHRFDDGKIIFVYSRYRGNDCNDNATCDLYKTVSYDGGETFVEDEPVFRCEDLGGTNIMSVSLVRLKNGNAGLFFIRKEGERKSTIMRSESTDGEKWSAPVKILHEEGYFVLNNDRLVRLADGRLAFPVSEHRVHDVLKESGWTTEFSPGVVYAYISNDDEHFFRTGLGYTINTPSGLQEPLLLQRKNGKVACYARTDKGCQYFMQAKDKGLSTWSEPKRTVFDGSIAPLSMKYIDENTLLAIWSNYPKKEDWNTWLENGNFTYYRSSFVCAYSKDDGKTFSSPKTIEYNLECGYCYCAIEPLGNEILLAYCSGSKEDGCCLNRITIRKIKLSEILA
jgi:hypothetical protein